MIDVSKVHIGKYVFSTYLILILTSCFLYAQNPVKADSTKPDKPVAPAASAQSNNKSVVKDAVEFQSSDSLTVDFRNGRIATLFGSAKVSHTAGTLTSGEIKMDLATSTVEAKSASPEDTLALPLLSLPDQDIKSNRILFNYKTQKGKFEEARVNVGEGNLIGSKVKNVSQTEVFIEDGIYSTCPPDYLYYYIKAKKMKVVDQDEIFFTNARLYVLDIPYPLVFPFGYVPSGIKQKQSGLLTPTYVFEAKSTRGIGLNNLGWFQYINDYVTTQASVDLFTSGSFYLDTRTQYRKTDLFNGSISIGYSREQGLEPTDLDFSKTVNKSLGIQHSQTISPYASLTANVNLRTADFYKRNSFDIGNRAQTSSTSKLAYNFKQPDNLFTLSTSAQLSQNFFNNSTRLSGPRASFSLKTLSPFQKNNNNRVGNPKWYESLTIRYNNRLESSFDYTPIDADSAEISFLEALADPSKYREATGDDDYIRTGLQQTAAISLSNIIPSQFINSSATINANEYWFPTSIRRTFNADSNTVETEKVIGFADGRDFSSSFSMSTTIYGISNRKIGNLEGFRHTIRPSLSLNYRPDFSDEKWGYYRTVQTDTSGTTQRYSIFQNEVFSGPGSGEQRSVSFSIANVFETKVVKRDTTGEVKERTLKLIDNLSLSSSYNFAADSLNLSSLTSSISSNAVKGINLRAGANFSFYQRDDLGRQINRFLIEDGSKLAQLQTFTVSATTSFRGGKKGVTSYTPVYRRKYDPFNQSIFSPVDPAFGYEAIDPLNSPWSFSLNFNYRWNYNFNNSPTRSATLNANSISFNLTPKWRFATTLGYDFIQKELTPSQFNLNRSLECWDLSFQISPFGDFQYYFFRLSVNSAQIQTLFQKLPILKNLERSSSPTGGSIYN